ncbi:nuclear transcription factor Y subunit B-4-like [Henckelia pumila]|uniref:nuclear transcription factor Y subunit B-4-like n=1 Tax=Henckelia pumila TaxID=405737 RepID=UPI003C6E35A8
MVENDNNIIPPFNHNLQVQTVLLTLTNCTAGVEDDQPLISREHDRLLPIANVGRIMKQILPPNAKISKESKETMQECVSEFVGFVTGEASSKCSQEKRKTMNGGDICWALGSLGFDDYAEALKRYLHKYREAEEERVHHNKAKEAPALVDLGLNLMERRRF